MSIFKDKIAELSKNAKIEYVNENYNPENMQKKIKEAAKDNPELEQMLNQQETAKKTTK